MTLTPVPLTPAATVVCLRDGPDGLEALLLLRNRALKAFGGAWVFPGGKLEPTDGHLDDHEIDRSRHAAAREAKEETGLAVEPSAMTPFSLWIPPVREQRRFKTWFFLAGVGPQSVQVDRDEILEHRWLRPHDVITSAPDPNFKIMPPTFVTLSQLAMHQTVAEAVSSASQRAPARFETRLQKTETGIAVYWEGDAAYESGDLHAPGPRRRLMAGDQPWRYEDSSES